ncbi:MAG: hypothetical protein HYV16_04485 [Gammaproteobacteria bacterium]|nr:hypothetical protein [Gammaproteobacteria bacterium]
MKLRIALVLSLALAGCLPPPQSTMINPAGFYASGQTGQGQSVTVSVQAAPGMQTVRDAASPKFALTPKNDYAKAIQSALVKGLKLQGYAASEGYSTGTSMQINITQLTTDIVKGTTTDEVHAQTRWELTIGNNTYTFSKTMVRDIPLKAGEEEASKTVNDLLGQVISDVINNNKVQQAIASPVSY